METCTRCDCVTCICSLIDGVMDQYGDSVEDMYSLYTEGVGHADNKCLACWFDPCRCADGLGSK